MTKFLLFLTILIGLSNNNYGQNQVIDLYKGAAPGSENWNWPEAENTKNDWGLRVIYNVA